MCLFQMAHLLTAQGTTAAEVNMVDARQTEDVSVAVDEVGDSLQNNGVLAS